jgi:ABC-2 type transport system ATP-binding protein
VNSPTELFEVFQISQPVAPVAAIDVSGLQKRYRGGALAVDGVTFGVAPGDFFAFLGPNGAGKTTTINAIVGLARFDTGTIKVFGHDVASDYRLARQAIGLAPQEFNFDRYLTVEEILVYQAGYFGVARDVARERAKVLLRQFSLWDKRDDEVAKLSGGMKRRLSLARALVHAPQILILDEPTAGVDLELRLELWDFLRALNRAGLTIFLTTHYLEEAEQLCNRVGIISQGRLVALDNKEALLAHQGHSRLELLFERPLDSLPRAWQGLQVTLEMDGRRAIIHQTEVEDVPRILQASEAAGHRLQNIHLARRNLQDIFLELTGKTNA